MPLHLLKLCVGIDSVEQLQQVQASRRENRAAAGEPPENVHRTRHFPRRAEEVLAGGSLYWIIKGFVRARQRILRFDELGDSEGLKRCGIVLDPAVVPTVLQARRPHQGWRYLEERDAPPDLPRQAGLAEEDELPPEMAAKLRDLGLL
ncbi:MAG TPA: DUF1489 domain-containing protein [Alphaproteobacteria bacterium]|nr:DUF1489 domain-containing protein [Alphaproteobacteria bacterium]